MSDDFDLIVVGGGPGGYVAAIRAAQLGLKTALVERDALGGVCLNWGCIPTKALLHGAEMAHNLNQAASLGFTFDNLQFDLSKLVAHSRSVAKRLSQGIEFLMKKNAVTVIAGEARLVDKCRLSVATKSGEEHYGAKHIILATGARPRNLPSIQIDGDRIWGAREAMTPTSLPQKLLIVGAGAIGVEFASFYNDLGTEVTLVEAVDRILPAEDREISDLARKALAARKIDIRTNTIVTGVSPNGEGDTAGIVATLEANGQSEQVEADRVILAVGITGNIENLGLEQLQVKTDRGFVVTDDYCKTNLVGLYAIGDVAGPPWLAHKASHEAVLCVEKIAGIDGVHPLNTNRIPGCTYCRPQVASVGLTEDAAKATGRALRIGRFNLAANGKALAMGQGEGLVKTIFDENSGELLGAHMIGPEVTEQIQGFGIAQVLEATETELSHTIFAHPTLSESMHESILDSLGRAIHQ